MNSLFATLGLIVLILYLSYQVMHALAQASAKSYLFFRLLLLPGVAIHELAHALACLATNTPIEHISIWTETGGQVVHHKPKYSLLTQPIISFAPFPVGIALLLWLSQLVRHTNWPIAIVGGILILSIAATLAPSKADLRPALFATALVLIGVIALSWRNPSFLTHYAPTLTALNRSLLTVAGLQAALWGVVTTARFLLHKAR